MHGRVLRLTPESVSGGTPRHGAAAHRSTRHLARRRGEGAAHPLRQGGERLRRPSPRWTWARIVVQELVQRADIDPRRSTRSSSARSSPRSPPRASPARWCSPPGCRGTSRRTPSRAPAPPPSRRSPTRPTPSRSALSRGGHRRRHRVHVATRPSSPAARSPRRWWRPPRRARSPRSSAPSSGSSRRTWSRSRPPSPSTPPASPWARARRRWPRRTASRRKEQDEIALASHQNARRGVEGGRVRRRR